MALDIEYRSNVLAENNFIDTCEMTVFHLPQGVNKLNLEYKKMYSGYIC